MAEAIADIAVGGRRIWLRLGLTGFSRRRRNSPLKNWGYSANERKWEIHHLAVVTNFFFALRRKGEAPDQQIMLAFCVKTRRRQYLEELRAQDKRGCTLTRFGIRCRYLGLRLLARRVGLHDRPASLC